MLIARSTVVAARRESLIAFYGPFASALLLIAVIVSRGSSGIQESPATLVSNDSETLLALEETPEGTGFTPYISMDSESDVQIVRSAYSETPPLSADVSIPQDAIQPRLNEPLPSVAIVLNESETTRNSGSISIEESIQRDIDSNALLMRTAGAGSSIDDSGPLFYLESVQEEVAILTSHTPGIRIPDSGNHELPLTQQENEPDAAGAISWMKLMNSLEQNSNLSLALSNTDASTQDSERYENASSIDESRMHRPDRTNRPTLPPAQLVRPIQRAGLLPPPIRPLIP